MEEISFARDNLLFIGFFLSGAFVLIFSLWTYKKEISLPSSAEIDVNRKELEQQRFELESLQDQVKNYHQVVAKQELAQTNKERIEEEIRQLEKRHKEFNDLSIEVQDLNERRDKLLRENEELNQKVNESHALIREGDLLRSENKERKTQKEKLNSEIESLMRESKEKNRELSEIQSHLGPLKEQFETLDNKRREAQKEHEKLEAHSDYLMTKINENEGKKELLEKAINSLKQSRSDMENEVTRLIKKEEELRNQINEHLDIDEEYKRKKRIVDEFEHKIECQKRDVESYERQIESLKLQFDSLSEQNGNPEKVLEDFSHPKLRTDLEVKNDDDETIALEGFENQLYDQGLTFSYRQIRAFHTALKSNLTSPLCILAGISGVGKSILPQKYAECMGFHFLNVPIQPRWDGPQDLIGFYNYLEKRYKATDLVRALSQMDAHNLETWSEFIPEMANNNLSDQMLLVLLDEMNIARVEYYFSEFLSRLEMRRNIDLNDESGRETAEISLEVGPTAGQSKPPNIFIGQNVMFVGTMNEDESTLTLSDKVLDRSCVLKFTAPDKFPSKGKLKERDCHTKFALGLNTWKSWCRSDPEDSRSVNNFLDKMQEEMKRLGKQFGHRVRNAIYDYVANYPKFEGGEADALADQFEMRLIPRLRGLETRHEGFENIKSIIDEQLKDEKLKEHFSKALESEYFEWKK